MKLLSIFAAGAFASAFAFAGADRAEAANLIDFTDRSQFSGESGSPLKGTLNGVGWTLVSKNGLDFNFTQNFDGGTCPVTELACESDGLGIVDDEITAGTDPVEKAVLTFDEAVGLVGIHFFDLFVGNQGAEVALVQADGTIKNVTATGTGGAGHEFLDLGGAEYTTIKFLTRNNIPGDDGTNDYAVAAIAAVPLPFAGLLMLTGLGGAAVAYRRRKAA